MELLPDGTQDLTNNLGEERLLVFISAGDPLSTLSQGGGGGEQDSRPSFPHSLGTQPAVARGASVSELGQVCSSG